MRIGDIGKKLVQDYAAAISMIPVKLTAELQKLTLLDLLKRNLSKLQRGLQVEAGARRPA